jgi:hypothetical protein
MYAHLFILFFPLQTQNPIDIALDRVDQSVLPPQARIKYIREMHARLSATPQDEVMVRNKYDRISVLFFQSKFKLIACVRA